MSPCQHAPSRLRRAGRDGATPRPRARRSRAPTLGHHSAARYTAQRETGDRRIGWGMHFQVTGDSHGSQPFGHRSFRFQLPASGSRLPMPGMPTPERLMPRWLSPDTRVYPPPSIQSSTQSSLNPLYSILHTLYSDFTYPYPYPYPLTPTLTSPSPHRLAAARRRGSASCRLRR
jgi:hypothetical protein